MPVSSTRQPPTIHLNKTESKTKAATTGKSGSENFHMAFPRSRPKTTATRGREAQRAWLAMVQETRDLRVADRLNPVAMDPIESLKTYTAVMKLAQDLTVVELKNILRANGSPVTGKKAVLMTRLAELNEVLDKADRDESNKERVIQETPRRSHNSNFIANEVEDQDSSILTGMRVQCCKGSFILSVRLFEL